MLTRADIEDALTVLAERLAAEGTRLRIYIVGSAALVLAGFDRPPTNATYYPHDELKPSSARWLADLLPQDPRAAR
jgi:hypothetical protein